MNTEIQKARIVLDTLAGGTLRSGNHEPPNGECRVCVEELRYLTSIVVWDGDVPRLPDDWDREEWTDTPDGGTPTERACQHLNDAAWPSDEARTEACLPLVALREADAVDGWTKRYAELTIRHVLPIALRAVGLESAAQRCERDGDAKSARAARAAYRSAAADAAFATAAAAYRSAAATAAYAATTAANAAAAADATASAATASAADAERARVLHIGVAVLIAAHTGAPYVQPEGGE